MNAKEINGWVQVHWRDLITPPIVIALAGVIWWAARLDDRLGQMEHNPSPIDVLMLSRLSVLETNQQAVLKRLDHIDQKLDGLMKDGK